jgi:hypothetical protein
MGGLPSREFLNSDRNVILTDNDSYTAAFATVDIEQPSQLSEQTNRNWVEFDPVLRSNHVITYNQLQMLIGKRSANDVFIGLNHPIYIHTLPIYDNVPTILYTLHAHHEEDIINTILSCNKQSTTSIIVYGKNHQDMSAIRKCQMLLELGCLEKYTDTTNFHWRTIPWRPRHIC